MKNRVNFYQLQYHPKLRLLNLSLVILCWTLVLILTLSGYIYLVSEQQHTKTEHAKVEQKQQQQQVLLDELITALEQKEPAADLLKKVDESQKRIQTKKRILKELNNQEAVQSSGFSRLMLDLAQYHQPGLWLTQISLDGKNVTIQGAANNSATIPKWVNTLAKTDYFQGQQFTNTRLFRDNNQQLRFVLATQSLPSGISGQSNE